MIRRTCATLVALLALLTLPACSLFQPSGPPAPAGGGGAQEGRRGGPAGEGGDDLEPYDEVVTEEAETQVGLFTVHRIDDELLYEIPDSVLGREMLLIGRPVEDSNQGGFFGGGPRAIVQWERDGHRVVLRQKQYDEVADPGSAIALNVERMRKGPIVAAFDVQTYGPDSAAVVDVTPLYTTSNDLMGSVDGLQRDLSWIEEVMAFPRNVEVEATQTGRVRGGSSPFPGAGGGNQQIPVTRRIHWSMMVLPEDPMMPRLHDDRVGYISSSWVDYSRPEHRAEERRFIHRFRLEPSDTAAFRRGELVEPVQPIVYWVDPATPDWLKPWVVKGVDEWNVAFEEAGFRNAIRGEVMPADDPEYDLHDARYSVIHWRPSDVANATGGQVVDPRSGEILKGEVNMYHNVQNLLRNWYFTQVSPLDARARNLPMPDSLMGRLVEYVVTHEIGHSIGFPHNMKASAMYPVDSLRSADFLRRMRGHVATLMDYSRFNYVAQPEDDIPPELLVPRVGPYDEFAVRWGYRPILDADTPDEELSTLDEWARVQDTVPYLRFTTHDSPNDPADLTEAVGDADAVRANELGLRNLERVVESLIPVAEEPGRSYDLLEELYENVASQWSRYMGHVAAVVGGADTQERYGTGERFFPLDRERQREAVLFLNERAFATPDLLIRPEILRRIEAEGVVDRVRTAQARVLQALMSSSRLARLIEYEALASDAYTPYTLADLSADVRAGVWGELEEGSVDVSIYRRNLQRSYLDVVDARLNPPEDDGPRSPFAPPAPDPGQTDIRPVLRGELLDIQSQAERAAARAANEMTRLHLEDVSDRIDEILDTDD